MKYSADISKIVDEMFSDYKFIIYNCVVINQAVRKI